MIANDKRITLEAARVNRGLTQAEVAKAIGVSKKTIWAWENGLSTPKIDKIESLCNLFGRTYDEIKWRA